MSVWDYVHCVGDMQALLVSIVHGRFLQTLMGLALVKVVLVRVLFGAVLRDRDGILAQSVSRVCKALGIRCPLRFRCPFTRWLPLDALVDVHPRPLLSRWISIHVRCCFSDGCPSHVGWCAD